MPMMNGAPIHNFIYIYIALAWDIALCNCTSIKAQLLIYTADVRYRTSQFYFDESTTFEIQRLYGISHCSRPPPKKNFKGQALYKQTPDQPQSGRYVKQCVCVYIVGLVVGLQQIHTINLKPPPSCSFASNMHTRIFQSHARRGRSCHNDCKSGYVLQKYSEGRAAGHVIVMTVVG